MGLAVTKQEAFWEACGFGHKERVRKLIAEGIDVNWVSYTHNSCAIHVASQGKEDIVRMLLDAGCNVNARDDRGNLALHHAAMKGHAAIAKILIDAGSEIDAQDKNGWTSLIAASYFCQPDVINVLLQHNCSVNMLNKDMRSALHETCRSPSDEEHSLQAIAKSLIENGADVNSKSSDVGEADFTPLIFCAYHGHPLVAQALIDAACDVNAQDSNSWTALHWACDRNHLDVVNVLINAGVSLHIAGKRGELAIDRAQSVEIRRILSAAMNTDFDQLSHGLQSTDDQLVNINNQITCTAAEHCALVESQLRETKSSSGSCSSVAESGSSGSEDLNRCDPDAADKDDFQNFDSSIQLDERVADDDNESNSSRTLDHADEAVTTERTVGQLCSA